MQEEFLLSICPYPTCDRDILRNKVKRRLSKMSLEESRIILDIFHYNPEEEVERRISNIDESHLFKIDKIEDFFIREIAKELIDESLNKIIYPEDYPNDCRVFSLDKKLWIASGGLSVGCTPSESMTYIDIIMESDILKGLNNYK